MGDYGPYQPPYLHINLDGGQQLVVYRVKRWQDGQSPALQIEYEAPFAIADSVKARRLAHDVWPAFFPYVNGIGLRAAILTGTNLHARSYVGLYCAAYRQSFGMIANESPSGVWRFQGEGEALPPVTDTLTPRIGRADGTPFPIATLAADPAPAQTVISGFEGFVWGTPAVDIERRFGKPVEDLHDGQLERISYKQGPDSGYLFGIHDQHGLVAGIRILPLPAGPRCIATIEAQKAAVTQRYPALHLAEQRHSSPDTAPCGGVGEWTVVWTDPLGGRVTLSTDIPKQRIYLMFASPKSPF